MTLAQHPQSGAWRTLTLPAAAGSMADLTYPDGYSDALQTVWEDGRLLVDQRFSEIRARAAAARL